MGSRDSGESPIVDINSRDSCASRDSFASISSEQNRSNHSSNCDTPGGSPSPLPNSKNNSSTTATPTSLTIGGQHSAFKKIK